MDIISNFGINPYLLGAQIINFLILLYLLKRFAYKPIFSMLDARKKKIEAGLKDAEESKKALEKALEEEKQILKKAQDSAQLILQEAKSQAESMSDEMKVKTKEQVEQMLSEAHVQLERETKALEKSLAMSTAKIAVEMVEKSIADMLDTKDQKEVIEKLTKKFNAKGK